MMASLLRVDIQNLPLVLGEHGAVTKNSTSTPDGSAEIPQCAYNSIIHHQHRRRFFIVIRDAHGCFLYINSQFLT